MLITVFTPTYNRAHLLPRLYESLCHQTFKDFEWVIVDDGSSDGTSQLFHPNDNVNDNENWGTAQKEKVLALQSVPRRFAEPVNVDFPIRYFYQENGGKHSVGV